MTASMLSANPPNMDLREIDAARALLGVSPAYSPAESSATSTVKYEGESGHVLEAPMHGFSAVNGDTTDASRPQEEEEEEEEEAQVLFRRPRSGSEGLDYLAALAEKERHVVLLEAPVTASSSSDEDSEAMPPPPPRRRPRSVSNPEGMEQWDLDRNSSSRRHLVLPAALLEEELAEAIVAVRHYRTSPSTPPIPEDSEYEEKEEFSELLSAEELLHRARSRLLHDLSAMQDEKGVLLLPHSLSKYKEVYNKDGRIGIYTPEERAAVLARFNGKRTRRNWNKKIRYNCRKNLADRRLRVKGRFIKRSEQEEMEKQHEEEEKATNPDDSMPDVTDPEAGFCPTADQPYRRLRRHTIT